MAAGALGAAAREAHWKAVAHRECSSTKQDAPCYGVVDISTTRRPVKVGQHPAPDLWRQRAWARKLRFEWPASFRPMTHASAEGPRGAVAAPPRRQHARGPREWARAFTGFYPPLAEDLVDLD